MTLSSALSLKDARLPLLSKCSVAAPADFLGGLAGGVAGIALGFLLGRQRYFTFGFLSGNQRLGLLGLALRLRSPVGRLGSLYGQFCLTHLLGGITLSLTARTRFVDRYPVEALFFEGRVLGRCTKFF